MSDNNQSASQNVALELCLNISDSLDLRDKSDDYRKDLLDLFAECLDAANGNR